MTETQTDTQVLNQARYIMDTGRLIHDLVARIVAGHLACGKRKMNELSLSQMDAIKAICREDGISITKLAGILKVSPPSASAMVDRLEEKGILVRERSEKDRRRVVVRISPHAARDFDHVEERILQSFVKLVEMLGPDTSRKWCEVLSRIKEIMETETIGI